MPKRKKLPLPPNDHAIIPIDISAYEELSYLSIHAKKLLIRVFNDNFRTGGEKFAEAQFKKGYGAMKKEMRFPLRQFKNRWISVKFNPIYPEEVLTTIEKMLRWYQRKLNFLGLRLPKEVKRKKLPFPKKPSNLPSKIIRRCHTKIKRQLGRYLKDKSHQKLRLTIASILEDEFDKLRDALKKIRLKSLEDRDAFEGGVIHCGHTDPYEYAERQRRQSRNP